MADAYTYPTPAMLDGYRSGVNRLPGTATTIASGQVVAAQQRPLTFRQRLAILIAGADGNILFGPQQPLQPIAQDAQMGALGRPWDYPTGFNTRVTPRGGEGIGFPQMKNLARYDVLAIMIQRVIDKCVAQTWTVVPKDKQAKRDARSDEVQRFMERPDKKNSFDDWLKMLLYQTIVYDTPCAWLRPTRGGDLYSMELMDGSLITPKIMGDGRLPPPEYGPAYQQVIKGMPAVDYVQPVPRGQPVALDPNGQPFPELLYKPKMPRIDSVYGFSPIEQLITTIQISINRETYVQQYYTQGSTADLIFSCPKEWNPKQIADFDVWFNALLQGNLAQRSKAHFVPEGVAPIDTKEKAKLVDEADEWFVRILCFGLGLNPMPFLKMMNKGQEKTHHDESAQEGLGPWNKFVSDFVGQAIALKFGYDDLVFRAEEEDSVDPTERATIDSTLVNAKIYHPDEIRAKRGDPPMADEMRLQMDMANFNAAPNSTVLPEEQQAAENEAAQALAAARPAPMTAAPGVAAKLGKAHARIGRQVATGRPY